MCENHNTRKSKYTNLETTFTCRSCGMDRPISYKEKDRPRCSICSGYRKHKSRGLTLSFSEFESNYIRNRDIGKGIKNRCNICLKVKDVKQFKGSHRGLCNDCWYTDDQLIIRRTRKIMRVPIRNSNRGVSLFNRTFNYSFNDFRNHIEGLFTDNMTWDGVVNKLIHIDHIIPASAFDHSRLDHFDICWSLSNLQPLWAADNQNKHDKLINGQRVQDIRRNKNYREIIDILINDLYGISLGSP